MSCRLHWSTASSKLFLASPFLRAKNPRRTARRTRFRSPMEDRYAMMPRTALHKPHVPAGAADSFLHEPRRHAHRLRDVRRGSAARVGGALGAPPQARLGQPGLASLAFAAWAASPAHPLRFPRIRIVGPGSGPVFSRKAV